ncbi:hypothetical protein JZX93_16545 [Acidomonas methanolica]|nr:DUF6880 family protein [Acidomonas methanolica]MCQ9157111.1 hypothetical protein [Acidomonas methanolica]
MGTTVTRENLQALGAERLAALLTELSENDAVLTRKLRMVLTAAHAKDRLGKEVEKRLTTIRRSRGFLSWDRLKPLAAELDALRRSILDEVAAVDVGQAVHAMRLLADLAPSVYERSDDSSGYLSEVFREAASDLGRLWGRLPGRTPEDVVHELLAVMDADGYGTCDHLLASCREALGDDGAALLRTTLLARLNALPTRTGRGHSREDYHVDMARSQILRHLRDLADVMSDVDAYIDAVDRSERRDVHIGAVARRLLDQCRAREALDWLARETGEGSRLRGETEDLRIEAHEAVGERDAAQALRWKVFQDRLSLSHWREYQRRLSDYDAIDAEERALAHIRDFPVKEAALTALLEWPAVDVAARLVREHADALDGRDYTTLRPAAERLSETCPNEATLLYRRLVEAVLEKAQSRYYPYAAKDLKACETLAPFLTGRDGMETHEAYMARLHAAHKRKFGFWAILGSSNPEE